MATLTAANQARLDKALGQQYRFSEGTMTLKAWMDAHAVQVTVAEVPKIQYNRIKFNRMDYREQAEYEKKLAERKLEYRAHKADGSLITIPKMVYELYRERLA